MGNFFEPGVKEYDAPYLEDAQNWFKDLEAPQMEVPDTPITQQAADQAGKSVSRFGPDLEKFFYGMMSGGGMPDLSTLLDSANKQYKMNQQDIQENIINSGLPRGSTAMSRALGKSLGQANNDFLLGLTRERLGAEERSMGRQFRGAGGLAGMPGYYGQPSSLERAMFQMKAPYELENFNALRDLQNQQANFMNNLAFYQPERIQEPSPFDKYVSPILNPVLQGAAAAIPFLESGGKISKHTGGRNANI
jgi:hypothetical protein